MAADVDPVSLKELITYVSTELLAANEEAVRDDRKVLLLDGCTVTVGYTVSRDQHGNVDLQVIGGAKGSSAEATNSIVVTFRAAGSVAFPAQARAASELGTVESIPSGEPEK